LGLKNYIPEGDAIDVQAVENFIRELHNAYRIDVAAFDPAYFLRSAQVLADDGVPMVEFPQSAARMVPASGTLFEEIVNGLPANVHVPLRLIRRGQAGFIALRIEE
jgi:phage terminase large subunit-like protein